MNIALYNGSPRGTKSNSTILLNHFIRGLTQQNPREVPQHYLTHTKERESQLEAFEKSDTALIIFPLYTDCMPALTLKFFEELHELGNFHLKKIGFIVQSGFPETIHSEAVKRYLKKFVLRHNGEYLGTIVKGGVEGTQKMPSFMTKGLFRRFYELGRYFAQTNAFSPKIKQEMGKPYRSSFAHRLRFRFFQKIDLANFYWDDKLKANKVFEKRFDAPYVD